MEFEENSDRFRVFGGIHIKYVASICAVFGVFATIGVFLFGLWIFPWHLYEDSVNTTGKVFEENCFKIELASRISKSTSSNYACLPAYSLVYAF